MTQAYAYEKDGAAIYRRSFAIIRGEADLCPLLAARGDASPCASSMPAAWSRRRDDLVFARRRGGSGGTGAESRRADLLRLEHGRRRHHARAASGDNEVICTLADPATPALAQKLGTTRTAAAIDLWLPRLGGAVVAIGNAPTALFRLLELIAAGAPTPAVDHRHAGRLRRRGGIEGGADRERTAGDRRPRPQRRQRHGGRRRQRAGERGGMSAGTPVRRRHRSGRSGAADRQGDARHRRGAGRRLLRQGRAARQRARHRRSLAQTAACRAAALLSDDHRIAFRRAALSRGARRVLRRERRRDRRPSRSRPRRRPARAKATRSSTARSCICSSACEQRFAVTIVPGVIVDLRRLGRGRDADDLGRRLARRSAGDAAAATELVAPPGARRRRRHHEDRPQSRPRREALAIGRHGGPGDLCRARDHGRTSASWRSPTRTTRPRRISR